MSQPTLSRRVVINNPQGLHARPADLFVREAGQFESRIEVVRGERRVDGKSIIEILTLGAEQGTELDIEATGSDAEAALNVLVELIENNFAVDESDGSE